MVLNGADGCGAKDQPLTRSLSLGDVESDPLEKWQSFDSTDSTDLYNFSPTELSVAVLGTGNYGIAFAERLQNVAYVDAVLGSRNGRADPKGFPLPCKVMSYEDAVDGANIIVFGIPAHAYGKVIESLGQKLNGKIIIDVSNSPPLTIGQRLRNLGLRRNDYESKSNAERLEDLLRGKGVVDYAIVKAFNNISAYTLSQPAGSVAMRKSCMLSGESAKAKKVVALLSKKMGFEVMHLGGKDAALAQEGCVHRFFQGWMAAITIGVFLAAVYAVYITIAYFVYGSADWRTFPKKTFLMVTGNVSSALLVLSFLPGPIACFWQLARGTARRPFPAWFGGWLQIRKQLGVLSFFVCIPHVIIACMGSAATQVFLVYQFAPVLGTVAFTSLYLMAMCSNSSVVGQFTMSEFKFIFVKVGYFAIVMTAAHLACITYYSYVLVGPNEVVKPGEAPPTVTYALALCCSALVIKIVASIPPISTLVDQIRAQQNVSILPRWLLHSPRDLESNSESWTAKSSQNGGAKQEGTLKSQVEEC